MLVTATRQCGLHGGQKTLLSAGATEEEQDKDQEDMQMLGFLPAV